MEINETMGTQNNVFPQMQNRSIPNVDIVIDEKGYWVQMEMQTTRDNKIPLLPETREKLETIAGRDGEIDFGTEFDSRVITLQCYSKNNMSKEELIALKEKLKNFLNPKSGTKTLMFLNQPDRVYTVKFTGLLEVEQYPNWLRTTISLKSTNPALYGYEEKVTSVNSVLVNKGNQPTGVQIEFGIGLSNPTVTINGKSISYQGVVDTTIYIDTELITAYKVVNGKNVNAMDKVRGDFIKINSGNNTLQLSDQTGKIRVKYKSKWI